MTSLTRSLTGLATLLCGAALVACSEDAARPGAQSAAGQSTGGSSAGAAGSATSGAGNATGGSGASGAAMGGSAGSTAGTAGGGGQATAGSSGSGGSSMVTCETPPSAAPAPTWVNATGNLAGMQSECGNLGLVSVQPCSNRVITGVALKGLWETLDGGQTWTALGSGAGSAAITNRISAIVYDPQDPQIFWESGIYNDGGVYKTTDSGKTFEQLGEITHCDSVSVDLKDPERKTLIAGPHETNNPLHYSKDGGATWSNISAGLPSGYCTATLVLDAMTFLVGCNSGSIVRTTNAGGNWTPVPGSMGGTNQPLVASDGTIYWPGANGGVWKSDDDGQSFTSSATPAQAPGIVAPAQFAELPDGRIVIIGADHLLISADQGESWSPIGEAMPFPGGGYDGARGVAYSAQTKTFFIWHWDCANVVPDDAIMSMGFDWEAQ
jgi:photosystem II stability/assembly factor-like uncharacterized protein